MAKATTSKSVMLSIRVPIDLHERILALCETDNAAVGTTVVVLLQRGLARPTQTLAALKADPANRIIDPKVSHVSGPVLADAVPLNITGHAVGFNPKSTWKTEGKAKS